MKDQNYYKPSFEFKNKYNFTSYKYELKNVDGIVVDMKIVDYLLRKKFEKAGYVFVGESVDKTSKKAYEAEETAFLKLQDERYEEYLRDLADDIGISYEAFNKAKAITDALLNNIDYEVTNEAYDMRLDPFEYYEGILRDNIRSLLSLKFL